MNRVHIQPAALSDVDEAASWYEAQRPGLGVEFVLEFDAAVARASESPEACAIQHRDTGAFWRGDPYAVYFTFEKPTIEISAVLHQKSDSYARQLPDS